MSHTTRLAIGDGLAPRIAPGPARGDARSVTSQDDKASLNANSDPAALSARSPNLPGPVPEA